MKVRVWITEEDLEVASNGGHPCYACLLIPAIERATDLQARSREHPDIKGDFQIGWELCIQVGQEKVFLGKDTSEKVHSILTYALHGGRLKEPWAFEFELPPL